MAATDFESAVAAIEALIDTERANAAIDPRCVPMLLHHGVRTERAVMLFHGFTNCPRQFAALAALFFDAGFNVYVPRLPRHGLLDKRTTALEALTLDELTESANAASALTARLGGSANALGLSLGATMVAWLAQTHALDRTIAISPFFSIARVPSVFEPALAGALSLVPNLDLWWDPRVKEKIGPAHGYPRFPTHALARCLQLGQTVRDSARTRPPRAVRNRLVLNAKDPAIDLPAARDVWRLWRAHGAAADEYVFENLDARHDIIEPTTYADAPVLVYPVLLDLMQR